jgi:hypothetical protein
VDLARTGCGAARIRLRLRPVRGGAPPWHRRRGCPGRHRGGSGDRGRLVRGDGSERRTNGRDPDTRRVRGDAAASRLALGQTGRGRGGGRDGRLRRLQRRRRARGAIGAPRRAPGFRSRRLPRPAALPARSCRESSGCSPAARARPRDGARAASASRSRGGRAAPCRHGACGPAADSIRPALARRGFAGAGRSPRARDRGVRRPERGCAGRGHRRPSCGSEPEPPRGARDGPPEPPVSPPVVEPASGQRAPSVRTAGLDARAGSAPPQLFEAVAATQLRAHARSPGGGCRPGSCARRGRGHGLAEPPREAREAHSYH